MNKRMWTMLLAVAVVAAGLSAVWAASEVKNTDGFKDTALLPGTQWHQHDPDRPQPPIVTPTPNPVEPTATAPSDAIVLFDGKDLSKWTDGKGNACTWKLDNGVATVRGGNAATKEEFGDCQLHIEWSAPTPPSGKGQGRGNSGVMFLGGRYEVQVLDNYDNLTYADGSAASLYGNHPPLANPCRKPGEWNVYDIIFTAPRFKDGKLQSPAYATVLFNGVVVQNHADFLGATTWRSLATYSAHKPTGPLVLQDHSNPMRYRNIWIRPLETQQPLTTTAPAN